MASALDSRRTSAVAESMASRPYSDATWMTQGGANPMGKGQILFTGPSGIRDYKVKVVTDDRMVGIGTMSPEGTSALQYIWRGAPGAAPPRRRSQWVGEVGWFIPPFHDYKNTLSGNQIQLKVFRKAQEEKYTHRFQEPWYPHPKDPSYKEMFPFTQGSKQNWRPPGQQRSTEQLPPRPHTVSSFHSNDRLPNVSNNAASSRPVTAQPPSSENISRPASGSSYSSAHFRSASVASPHHSPPGSRPGSGGSHGQYNRESSAYGSHSRGSQSSLRSRASSQTSHQSRRRITPAATSVSSAYRAPTSDPEY
ncbi:uncharacterized protein LOC135157495 isoform X1 [Lytechinus pictus]|uniref:uncharacterized protein LOC135157495 isoform X1 n=1 Tax=Lytechinus pictus TaxID=7653 RepID=UPI0030B9EF32